MIVLECLWCFNSFPHCTCTLPVLLFDNVLFIYLYTCDRHVMNGIKILYCIVLYCIVLNWTVLCCIVLCCAVLFCSVLYCIVWMVLYCIVLYCIVLYCIVSYRIVSYRIVLNCIVLLNCMFVLYLCFYNIIWVTITGYTEMGLNVISINAYFPF